MLVVAQVVVFNHICLFGMAVPFVFIYLLIALPLTMGQAKVISIAFFLGLTVDIFRIQPASMPSGVPLWQHCGTL